MKEGWEYKRLGEICDFQGGSQPPKSEWTDSLLDGYVRMLQIRDFTQSRKVSPEYVKSSKKLRFCKSDDILLGRYGASVGKVLTGLEGAYNVAIMKTIPNESVISKRYIKRYFESDLFQDILKRVCGIRAAQAGFSKEDIENELVPVPSLAEQQQIVSFLDSEFEKIDALKANAETQLQAAKDLFQAALKEKLTPKDGWDSGCLGDIAYIIHGKSQKEVEDKNGKYPIYGSGGNVMGYANDFLCDSGTTILGRKGTINNPIYIDCDFWNVDTAFGIKAKDNVNRKFLYYVIKSEDWLKRNTGTTLPSLTQTVVLSVPIIFPKSQQEQQAIADNLDTLSAKIKQLQENYNETTTLCNDLKQSLLKRIFE